MAWPWRSAVEEPPMEDIAYGIETVINTNLLNEMNPMIFSVIELVLTQMDLPIPPSQIPVGPLGTLRVFFDDTRCKAVRLDHSGVKAGLFLDKDLVGLTFKMDLKCDVKFSTNLRFLQAGTANITISGVNPFAELGLTYLSDTKQLTPVLKTFDIKFKSIDAVMDNRPFVNVILKVFHHMLPPIVSFSMKGIVKSLVPRISSLLLDPKIAIPNNHGQTDQYHVVVNEPPILTKKFARFNVSLEPGDGNVFTPMKDISKKSPFEIYLEAYQDSENENYYRIQGLDIEKDFKAEMDAQHADNSKPLGTKNFGTSKYEAEPDEITPPRGRAHGNHNLKYF